MQARALSPVFSDFVFCVLFMYLLCPACHGALEPMATLIVACKQSCGAFFLSVCLLLGLSTACAKLRSPELCNVGCQGCPRGFESLCNSVSASRGSKSWQLRLGVLMPLRNTLLAAFAHTILEIIIIIIIIIIIRIHFDSRCRPCYLLLASSCPVRRGSLAMACSGPLSLADVTSPDVAASAAAASAASQDLGRVDAYSYQMENAPEATLYCSCGADGGGRSCAWFRDEYTGWQPLSTWSKSDWPLKTIRVKFNCKVHPHPPHECVAFWSDEAMAYVGEDYRRRRVSLALKCSWRIDGSSGTRQLIEIVVPPPRPSHPPPGWAPDCDTTYTLSTSS